MINFIKYFSVILLSISLIGCANNIDTNEELSEESTRLVIKSMNRASDESLVGFYKEYVNYRIIEKSSNYSKEEKKIAENKLFQETVKLIASVDTNKPEYALTEADEVAAISDLMGALAASGVKTKEDINESVVLDAILYKLPTHKSARLIKFLLKTSEYFK